MMEQKSGRTFLKFKIPSRGITGLNNLALTKQSSGEAVVAHRFIDF